MELSIADFRCFHKPHPVEARPINILVGENSAGKTSFLSAVRFMFDLFDRGSRASFNKDPFHLGSYESIAHYRGGRFGRAQSFSFQIRGNLRPRRPGGTARPHLFPELEEMSNAEYTIEIKFVDRKSQPAVEQIVFLAGEFGFSINISESVVCRITTPNFQEFEIPSDSRIFGDDSSTLDLSFVEILLRSYAFRRAREKIDDTTRQPSAREVEALYSLFMDSLRTLPSNVYASAPVRSRPERTYNPTDYTAAADGAHVPFVLAQLNYFEPAKWEEIRETLSVFGKASGLFQDVSIKQIGKSAGGPFQIVVNMANRKSNIMDVGYGVSQALPIITDILRASRGSLFLFQQPEVHLHPRAQAELGSFFSQITRRHHHRFFIETHSDHLIDRIRMHVRDGIHLKPSDVAILYFERDGHDVNIHNISIDRLGNLIGTPPTYREFFLQEELRSLGAGKRHADNN